MNTTITDLDLTFVVAEEPDTMLIDLRTAINEADLPHLPASRQPAATYLAGLGQSSQHTQRGALDAIALYLSVDRCDRDRLPWWMPRRQHANAVRAWCAST